MKLTADGQSQFTGCKITHQCFLCIVGEDSPSLSHLVFSSFLPFVIQEQFGQSSNQTIAMIIVSDGDWVRFSHPSGFANQLVLFPRQIPRRCLQMKHGIKNKLKFRPTGSENCVEATRRIVEGFLRLLLDFPSAQKQTSAIDMVNMATKEEKACCFRPLQASNAITAKGT